MKYGMNLLLWTDHLHDGLLPTLEKIKKLGYDGVEIPLFDLSLDYAAWGRKLDDLGLERTAVTVRGGADNPISPDAKIRAAGVAASKKTLDCCQAAGAQLLVGPYHSAIGEFSGQGPTADEWKWGVESMRQVAEHAKQAGVGLAVEYLNRFECYLLNTAADTARFIRDVNHPSCRMMYDTFHANIEEKSPAEAIRTAAPQHGFGAYFRERPQHARHGQCPLDSDIRHAARSELQRLAGRRGFWLGVAGARGRDEDLAPHVSKRRATRPRRISLHAPRSEQAMVEDLSNIFSLSRSSRLRGEYFRA